MNHTPMEVMLDEQVEKLKAINADLPEALEEILDYSGGADNALKDEYVMERASEAIRKAKENER